MSREQLMHGLGALLRSESHDVDPAHHAREGDRLLEALLVRRRRSRWQRMQTPARWLGAVAAAAAVVAALMIVWPDADLEYRVDGAALAEGGYLRADASEATIHFSDGSEIVLARGSVARLVDVGSKGARLVLEAGAASLNIHHGDEAMWSVAAGPFVVDVTGTRFSLEWQPSQQRLDVKLEQGAVVVRGPMLADGVRLREGQTLAAELPSRRVEIAEPRDASASTSAAPSPASAEPGHASASAETSAIVPPPVEHTPWSKRVAAGQYANVLSEAHARGIDSVLGSGSLDDLVALADAARYAGRGDLAQRALQSVRSRFASSDAARTAAFLLGRMAEGGAPAAAIGWYDRYLAEAPGGTFASEALGRKMLLLRSSSPAQARAVAKQYLKSFPKGAYAQVARDLAGR